MRQALAALSEEDFANANEYNKKRDEIIAYYEQRLGYFTQE